MNAPMPLPDLINLELSYSKTEQDGIQFLFDGKAAPGDFDEFRIAIDGNITSPKKEPIGRAWSQALIAKAANLRLGIEAVYKNNMYVFTGFLNVGSNDAGDPAVIVVTEASNGSIEAAGEVYAVDGRYSDGVTIKAAKSGGAYDFNGAKDFRFILGTGNEKTPSINQTLLIVLARVVTVPTTPPLKKIEATLRNKNGQQTPLRVFFSNEIMFGMPKHGPKGMPDGYFDKYIRYLPDDVGTLTREHFKFCYESDGKLSIQTLRASVTVDGESLSANSNAAWVPAESLHISLDESGQHRLELSEIVNMPSVLAFNATGVAQGKRSSLGIILWCYALGEQQFTAMGVRFKMSSGVLSVLSNGNWFPLDKAIIDSCIEI